jgi:four helix bundle protein
VFQQADELVLSVYQLTRVLPVEERFGLQSQIRRAAVSTATNIVEGSGRETRAEYRRFLDIAHASSREVGYLIDLASRLELLEGTSARDLVARYDGLSAGLGSLIASIGPGRLKTGSSPPCA